MGTRVLNKPDLLYPDLSYEIVGCAFEVYNEMGSGHMEKYYQKALSIAFDHKNLNYLQQVYHPLKFKNQIVGKTYLDFVVNDKIVVEIKQGERYSKAHIDQVLNYLKLSNLKLAILINFGNEGVKFKRIINLESNS